MRRRRVDPEREESGGTPRHHHQLPRQDWHLLRHLPNHSRLRPLHYQRRYKKTNQILEFSSLFSSRSLLQPRKGVIRKKGNPFLTNLVIFGERFWKEPVKDIIFCFFLHFVPITQSVRLIWLETFTFFSCRNPQYKGVVIVFWLFYRDFTCLILNARQTDSDPCKNTNIIRLPSTENCVVCV